MKRLVACVVLAAAPTAHAGDADTRAVAYVKQLGGQASRDAALPGSPVTHVNLARKRVTDAGLKDLRGLTHLKSLVLYGTDVSDAGLKELAGLTSLTRLELSKTKVTDAGLKELARLENLAHLSLEDTAVTGTGFEGLDGLKGLTDLALEKSVATDDGLKGIVSLRRLTSLDLQGTKVTDAGLKDLAPLKGLTCLSLPLVNDRTLAELRDVNLLHAIRQAVNHRGGNPKNLEDVGSLYLSGTRLTDAGVADLARFKNVSVIYLSDTRLTADGVAALQRALPNSRIVR